VSRLEDLTPNAAVRGVLPDALVTLVAVKWFGSEALELTYKDPAGRASNTLLYRADEKRLAIADQGRPWSFDGDGALFRLVSEALVSEIAQLIRSRVARSTRQLQFAPLDLEEEVRKGLARMRVIEPKVRIVTKEVSWESTRDKEFTQVLRSALKAEELAGWFEEFTAAKQRTVGANGLGDN
jgi:hypothetical protein